MLTPRDAERIESGLGIEPGERWEVENHTETARLLIREEESGRIGAWTQQFYVPTNAAFYCTRVYIAGLTSRELGGQVYIESRATGRNHGTFPLFWFGLRNNRLLQVPMLFFRADCIALSFNFGTHLEVGLDLLGKPRKERVIFITMMGARVYTSRLH